MGLQLLLDLSRCPTPFCSVGCGRQDHHECLNRAPLIDTEEKNQERTLSRPCAQILCGDFNTPPHYPGYRMLNGGDITLDSLQIMKDIGLDNYAYPNEVSSLHHYQINSDFLLFKM